MDSELLRHDSAPRIPAPLMLGQRTAFEGQISQPRGTVWAVVSAALIWACQNGTEGELARFDQPLVYGTDDRQELYDVPGGTLRQLAEDSVVALVADATWPGAIQSDPTSLFGVPSWQQRRALCDSVRFADQPAAATCSGVLADDDLVLTAGHCARNLDCGTLSVVFGYHYLNEGETPSLADDDVYRCAEVLTFDIPNEFEAVDQGWIRLDRRVSSDKRAAVLERRPEPLDASQRLYAFDFGGGVPLKAHSGVSVQDPRAEQLDYFVTSFDAFEGSSGAPLTRADGTVVGIFAHGNPDYVETSAGCFDVEVLPDSAGAERATYAFQALTALCRDAPDSTNLCGAGAAERPPSGCSLVGPRTVGAFSWVLLTGLLMILRRAGSTVG
jgi:trypsin-like peptidase